MSKTKQSKKRSAQRVKTEVALEIRMREYLRLRKQLQNRMRRHGEKIAQLETNIRKRTARDFAQLRSLARAVERCGITIARAHNKKSVRASCGSVNIRSVSEVVVSNEAKVLKQLRRIASNMRLPRATRKRAAECIRVKESLSKAAVKQRPDILKKLRHAVLEVHDSVGVVPVGSKKPVSLRIEENTFEGLR